MDQYTKTPRSEAEPFWLDPIFVTAVFSGTIFVVVVLSILFQPAN